MTTILVVDDDPQLLKLIQQYLVSEGFRVVAVDNVDDGLKYSQSADALDLAIVDFWLNGAPSTEVLDCLLENRPTCPFIMMTGGNGDIPIETTHAISKVSGAASFLQKPFRRAALVAEVRNLLG